MAIKMAVEKITPEKAVSYLKKNVANYRTIRRDKVAVYAEEMKDGKWQLNGETIVFDESGNLKDGQHRLAAIVMAGVPVEMTVITGVKDDVNIYDSGMNRTLKQIMEASGCDSISNTEAAVATAVVGQLDRVPKGKVVAWMKDHYMDVKRAYRICGASRRTSLSCRMSCVLTTYFMLYEEKMRPYELETFFLVFNSGNADDASGYEASPALISRRMFEERYIGRNGDKRMIMEQIEILIMAIKDFQKGTKRTVAYAVKEPKECNRLLSLVSEK